MRNSSLLHRPISATAAPQRKTGHTSPPHIFQPETETEQRDFTTLFNLKRRPGYFNSEASAALLRRSKQPPHDEIFVDFAGRQVHLALAAGGAALVAGYWTWQATANGESLVSETPWNVIRWESEKAFDYLELEQQLSGGWRLRRQLLLARDDRFLLLADGLVGEHSAPVELRYSSCLPLVGEASFDPAQESREGWFSTDITRRLTAIPLALPEWRCEFSHGSLLADNRRLILSDAALGKSLYAPLWIDLDPRRARRPLTWRHLTVGENQAAVPRDVAAAYRVQAGQQQWLIYRSLGKAANRTAIGYNTLQSFVVARIGADAAVKEIVEIE